MISHRLRGKESEDNVGNALVKMRKAGVVECFWRTEPLGPDDVAGIDFFVKYKGMLVPLQVKSSELGKRLHELRYENINCVVGRGPGLTCRIKRAIRDYRLTMLGVAKLDG